MYVHKKKEGAAIINSNDEYNLFSNEPMKQESPLPPFLPNHHLLVLSSPPPLPPLLPPFSLLHLVPQLQIAVLPSDA